MAYTSLFAICFVVFIVGCCQAESHFEVPFKFPFHLKFQKRQALGNSAQSCALAQYSCMAPIAGFWGDWERAYVSGTPFNTGPTRVDAFCESVDDVTRCLQSTAECVQGPPRDILIRNFQYACSLPGRRQLTDMNGTRCNPSISTDDLENQCMNRHFDDNLIDNSVCGYLRAVDNCERAAIVTKCGEAVANFAASVNPSQFTNC